MKPTRKSFGSVFSVPRQEPGAIANCAYCDWSRFFPNRKRKRGSSRSRGKRALVGHVRKAHPDKLPKFWDPTFEPMGDDPSKELTLGEGVPGGR